MSSRNFATIRKHDMPMPLFFLPLAPETSPNLARRPSETSFFLPLAPVISSPPARRSSVPLARRSSSVSSESSEPFKVLKLAPVHLE